MSAARVLLLGGIAGATIFLGLPLGRVRRLSSSPRALLNALAIGILLFLLWDVLSHAVDPVEHALTAAALEHNGSWLRFAGLATTLVVCLGAGLLSLVYYDRWLSGRSRPFGPGAAAASELQAPSRLAQLSH